MQTIVINNQKGGVGKTMLAVHLAWFLAESDARVLFVDLDGQGNGSSVLSAERQAYPAADLFEANASIAIEGEPGITVLSRDTRLHIIELAQVPVMLRHFATLNPHFDYCVIDTPPNWGARNFAAMAVCDFLLSPIELKDFAIEGVGQLLQSILAVQEKGRGGRKINFLGLVASRFNSHSPRERTNLEALVSKIGTKMMFPGVITARDGYEQAMSDRKPVWAIKSSGATVAAAEMRKILGEVRKRVVAAAEKETA
ncbi:ParA family protein [Sphingomonas sp. PAMC 26605]|uniref:ParA family protein n=1 Tax=Sphingomonas sp. PAMC 26605 TaxID=1112214 RepID=UPI00026CB9AD|nr:ParA family protein [Sphingomonas sp. PAMC 26605]